MPILLGGIYRTVPGFRDQSLSFDTVRRSLGVCFLVLKGEGGWRRRNARWKRRRFVSEKERLFKVILNEGL